MPRFLLTTKARSDLRDIWSYLEAESQSLATDDYPTAADRVLKRIYEVFGSLATHPSMGRTSSISEELRVFSAHRYLIFYRPAQDGIQVARVLHAARNIRLEDFIQR